MNIQQIFKELIVAPTSEGKYNTKLVDYDISNRYKILLATDILSENQQCVLLQLKNGGQRSEMIINNINTLDSIYIDTLPAQNHGATNLDTYYSIKLNKDTEEDIFYAFILDLIKTVKSSIDDLVILDVLKRVQSWMVFFKSKKTGVLSETSQIGLFAELSMLKVLLEGNSNKLVQTVLSWVGPKKQNQDFIFPNTQAIEVKCTTTNNPNDIKISNEYQLDVTGLSKLFLAVYHVKRHKITEDSLFPSLPDIIKEIRVLLTENFAATSEFENLLIEVGYFEEAEIEYIDFGFQMINSPDVYDVNSDFPKLSRATVSQAIKKIEYTINLQEQNVLDSNINDIIKF